MSGESPLIDSYMALFSVRPHMEEGDRELLDIFFAYVYIYIYIDIDIYIDTYIHISREREREEGREKERGKNINVWLPLMYSLLGTWPATPACALTGNQTSDPLVHRPVLNPLSHTSQGSGYLL